MTYPETVNIIDLAPAPFNCARDAIAYAKNSYEITNVEVLRGNAECAIQPSNNTSTFDVSILLHGVCDVNGVPLLANEKPEEPSLHIDTFGGRTNATVTK